MTFWCSCCGGPLDRIEMEYECTRGHTHVFALHVCRRCDSIDVAEVANRLIKAEKKRDGERQS